MQNRFLKMQKIKKSIIVFEAILVGIFIILGLLSFQFGIEKLMGMDTLGIANFLMSVAVFSSGFINLLSILQKKDKGRNIIIMMFFWSFGLIWIIMSFSRLMKKF